MNRTISVISLIFVLFANAYSQDFQSYITKGDSCKDLRNFSEAIKFYNKALDLKPERIITAEDEVVVFSKMGNVYTEIAEYQTAITYYFKYLEKEVVKSNDTLCSSTYNAIGVNYHYLLQEDQALKFYKKCVKAACGDSIQIGGAYNNIANIYHMQGDLGLAKEYYTKALNHFEQKQYYRGLVATAMNIGIIELEKDKIETALSYFNKAKDLAKEQHDTLTYIIVSINLGDFYTRITDYDQAKEYLEWALENAKKQNSRMLVSEAYKSLVSLYKTQEDYREAFNYLELYKASSDSILKRNSSREYAELEAKYSIREKETENKLLIKEQHFAEIQYKAQKKYIWMLSGLVILAILFIGLFYLQRRKITKAKKILESQNKEIKKSQKQLESLNLQYEKLIEKYEGGVVGYKPTAELS